MRPRTRRVAPAKQPCQKTCAQPKRAQHWYAQGVVSSTHVFRPPATDEPALQTCQNRQLSAARDVGLVLQALNRYADRLSVRLAGFTNRRCRATTAKHGELTMRVATFVKRCVLSPCLACNCRCAGGKLTSSASTRPARRDLSSTGSSCRHAVASFCRAACGHGPSFKLHRCILGRRATEQRACPGGI